MTTTPLPQRAPDQSAARRVLMLAFYAQLGGAELYLTEWLRWQNRSRYQPVVATPGDGDLARALRRDGVPVVGANGFTHLVTYSRSLTEIGRNGLRIAAMLSGLRRAARRVGAALVHADGVATFKYAGLVGRSLNRPVVGTLHDALTVELGWTPLKQRLVALNINSTFDRVICVSEATRRAAIAGGARPDRLTTILNGVDAQRYAAQPGDRERFRAEFGFADADVVVVMVGRYAKRKGHHTLLAAIKPLIAATPNLHVMLVGSAVFAQDQSEAATVIDAVADPGFCGRVHVTGWRDDMAAVYAGADIVVAPSTLPDPMPGVVLQAMAAGRPLIGSATGGIPEAMVDRETGDLTPPGDVEALRQAISALIADPARRARYGAAGQQRIRADFGLDRYARDVEALYDEVIAARTRAP